MDDAITLNQKITKKKCKILWVTLSFKTSVIIVTKKIFQLNIIIRQIFAISFIHYYYYY